MAEKCLKKLYQQPVCVMNIGPIALNPKPNSGLDWIQLEKKVTLQKKRLSIADDARTW